MKRALANELLQVQIQQLRAELFNLKLQGLRSRHLRDISQSSNPLNKFGAKVFSQTDEDGITLEIIRRIFGETSQFFWEFGVGDGTENNTLVLLAKGWRGEWFGNEDLALDPTLVENGPLLYRKGWLSRDSFDLLLQRPSVTSNPPALISIDLDGNDYHFVKAILEQGIRPSVFIVEYNAKFLPGLEWIMPYEIDHVWQGNDYFGASLTSFSKLFESFGFRLVCCNAATGANAFYVDLAHAELFEDVPLDESHLYMPPNYQLPGPNGHPQSIKMIESLLKA